MEKGYSARVDPSSQAAHQTLVRQMNWLDRNMETLLQQAPAPTVRFIAHSNRANENTAVKTPQQQTVKHFIDATAEPITKGAEATSSKPVGNNYAYNPVQNNSTITSNSSSSSSTTAKPPVPTVEPKSPKPPVSKPPTTKKEQQHDFTLSEIRAAEKRRKHELRQLQTRFCDSFKTVR